ncbi:MAG: hypothetical protein GPJ54_12115 [Candidatus Heimdallarchaeota archaeon]|nr:hypothetical protein [Candidatus Heimdallarchaeota archaeon]
MKLTQITLSVFLISLIAFSVAVNSSAELDGENRGDNILIETDTLAVEIKGGSNVPYFFFWHQDEVNMTYNLHLDRIFEVEDTNENNVYDTDLETEVLNSRMNLASLNWEFSEFVEDVVDGITTGLHFNLTSNDSNAHPNDSDPIIQFRVHLNSDNAAELKFDVVIDDYTFVSDTAMLVIGYKITTSENRAMERNNDTVSFGDGYFQYEENATANSTRNIQVGLSTNVENNNPMIFLAYEHFEGLMVHDPIIGVYDSDIIPVDSETSVTSDTNGEITDTTLDDGKASDQNSDGTKIEFPELSRGALLASTVLASLMFILVPSIVYSRRR